MDSYYIGAEHDWEDVSPDISRKIIGHTPELMSVLVRFNKGAIGQAHSHDDHDQIAYVMAGSFETEVNGVTRTLHTGDAYIARKTMRHGVVALEADSLLLDMFSPRRDDFLSKMA